MNKDPRQQALSVCDHATFVEGEGPADADVMLIGQNPGAEENRTGRPFVGRAGHYLNKVLAKYALDREAMFITSLVKCKTPSSRKPNEAEIAASLPYLDEQIQGIDPDIIMLMGTVARRTTRFYNIEYISTVHPAAAMRFPAMDKRFRNAVQELEQKVKKLTP